MSHVDILPVTILTFYKNSKIIATQLKASFNKSPTFIFNYTFKDVTILKTKPPPTTKTTPPVTARRMTSSLYFSYSQFVWHNTYLQLLLISEPLWYCGDDREICESCGTN